MVRTSGTKKSYAIELQTRSILRDWLEYPTENVSFIYLAAINKIYIDIPEGGGRSQADFILTLDDFSDKAVKGVMVEGTGLFARWNSVNDWYECDLAAISGAADFRLRKLVGGTYTILGTESVDITAETRHLIMLSVSGSTLNAYREDMTTPKITATDTDFASGKFGAFPSTSGGSNSVTGINLMLMPPSSTGPKAKAVMEIDITGKGTDDDPIRPNLLEDYPVTWGAYEYKDKDSTMMVVIFDAPDDTNISQQLSNASSKGYLAMDVPDTWSYYDTVKFYQEIRKEWWIAGKDNFAYHVLRIRPVELFQNADFYYGNIVDLGNVEPFKKIPDFEMWRRLDKLEKDLLNITILTEERDKHLNKVREVKKLGW